MCRTRRADAAQHRRSTSPFDIKGGAGVTNIKKEDCILCTKYLHKVSLEAVDSKTVEQRIRPRSISSHKKHVAGKILLSMPGEVDKHDILRLDRARQKTNSLEYRAPRGRLAEQDVHILLANPNCRRGETPGDCGRILYRKAQSLRRLIALTTIHPNNKSVSLRMYRQGPN